MLKFPESALIDDWQHSLREAGAVLSYLQSQYWITSTEYRDLQEARKTLGFCLSETQEYRAPLIGSVSKKKA